MPNPKLIFVDGDGTLLCRDGSVTEENRAAITKALEQGHQVAVTTGRSIQGARPILEALGVAGGGVYLLAYQGSVLYDWGRKSVLHRDGIPGRKVMELMAALDEAGIYAHTFSDEGILTLRESEELEVYSRQTPEAHQVLKDLRELENGVYPKVMAMDFHSDRKLLAFQKVYAPWEADSLNSFFSAACYLEYCKKGCNKGTGLRRLAELLNWPIADTIAVGDERNDISMIQAAGLGVAMENARPEVKAAAGFVTEHDCDHSGVAEVLNRFVLESL